MGRRTKSDKGLRLLEFSPLFGPLNEGLLSTASFIFLPLSSAGVEQTDVQCCHLLSVPPFCPNIYFCCHRTLLLLFLNWNNLCAFVFVATSKQGCPSKLVFRLGRKVVINHIATTFDCV